MTPAEAYLGLSKTFFLPYPPGLVFCPTQSQPTPLIEQAQSGDLDKGICEARRVHFEKPHNAGPTSQSRNEAFVDVLRHVMELSKPTSTPQSHDDMSSAGPSLLLSQLEAEDKISSSCHWYPRLSGQIDAVVNFRSLLRDHCNLALMSSGPTFEAIIVSCSLWP